MNLKVENNLYVIQIDGTTLAMSKEDFVKSLRMGKWWRRRHAMAPREATMQDHAEEARQQGPDGMQRTSKR